VFFHQGAPALGEGALRTGQGLAKLRAAAAAHLSPAGQLQAATALDMLAATEARMGPLRKQLTCPGARKIVRQACHILTELGGDALTTA